jgi:hypothetical protein
MQVSALVPTAWNVMELSMKTVSEQEKARLLRTLTKDDLGEASYNFVHGAVARYSIAENLAGMSEKQQKWFDDLYDKHFGG